MLVYENGEYIAKDNVEMPEAHIPYEEKVILYIREKYSVNEELAIQRQRETKPDEFSEYFLYCEECKQRAKAETEV